MNHDCTLILPCLNEAAALPGVLARVPEGITVLVVDNGSTDDTVAVATRLGVRVVHEPQPGYGAAVHTGVLAAQTELIAVMDADGSFDGTDLLPLIADVRNQAAQMAVGRRRPVSAGAWPWHARLGNRAVVAYLRHRAGFVARDIAPIRVCRRADLLALGVADRRFGYPVELMQKATLAGWRIKEYDVAYHPRALGTKSKVSGSVLGTVRAARDFAAVLR